MEPRRNDALNSVQEKNKQTNKQTKTKQPWSFITNAAVTVGDRTCLAGISFLSPDVEGSPPSSKTSVKVIKERNSSKPKSNFFKGKVTFAFQKLIHCQFANREWVIRQETFIWVEIGRISLTQFSQWAGSRGNVVERGSFAPPFFPNFSLNGCLLLLARLHPNRWRDIYDEGKITVSFLARGDRGEGKRK